MIRVTQYRDVSRTLWTCTQETISLASGDATWVPGTGERRAGCLVLAAFLGKLCVTLANKLFFNKIIIDRRKIYKKLTLTQHIKLYTYLCSKSHLLQVGDHLILALK